MLLFVVSAAMDVAVISIVASLPIPTVASRSSVVATRSESASASPAVNSSIPPSVAVSVIVSAAVTTPTRMSPVVLEMSTSLPAPIAVTETAESPLVSSR